jgi:GATA zinc finger
LHKHPTDISSNVERSMRPSTSLSALTGERSEIPHIRPTPSLHDQRWIDPENNRWQERSAERNRAKESMRLDIPPESNFPPRDRTSSSNGRSLISSNEQEYPFEMAGPSRLGGTVPPPLASPHGNLPRHPNDSPRSSYSAREPSSSRVLETDVFNHRPTLHAQQHGGNNPAGLPVPQPPSRPFQPGRRASSDYGGTPYPTTYSPPYHQNQKGDECYSFRPPSDHFSAQNNSRTPSGYYRDEYKDNNHHDHSYISGDESGSGSMGFRPSKYRKRSRAPAPGSCVSCGVRDTPEWRRGPNGARTLCNACGLHFSKLLRRKKQEQGNDSANVTVEELRSSLKLPGNGSTGQMSPSF